jgi:hypothetical protein
MKRPHVIFVRDAQDFAKTLFGLKQRVCPFCGRRGTLNRHSRVRGNDPQAAQGRVVRGQRVFCSNRGRRGGCGRTFPILFAPVLPRHTFTARLLWQALAGWLRGSSLKASWEAARSPLALDTFYHLVQRLRQRLNEWRTALHTLAAPPVSEASDPLRQTFEHLRRVFRSDACPLESFQLRLQRPLMG